MATSYKPNDEEKVVRMDDCDLFAILNLTIVNYLTLKQINNTRISFKSFPQSFSRASSSSVTSPAQVVVMDCKSQTRVVC